jgi:hypothetical protein
VQIMCYGLALGGWYMDRAGKRPAIFYFPFYFLYIHLAAFYAVIMTWRGSNVATWHPAERITLEVGDP